MVVGHLDIVVVLVDRVAEDAVRWAGIQVNVDAVPLVELNCVPGARVRAADVVVARDVARYTPARPLPRAVVPSILVPMKLPWMRLARVAPSPTVHGRTRRCRSSPR